MMDRAVEQDFIETLRIVEAMHTTAAEIKNNRSLYNELAEEAMELFTKSILHNSRIRAVIASSGIPYLEAADDSVMKLLDNIDKVIKCDENGRIGFIVQMTLNMLIDKARARRKAKYTEENDSPAYTPTSDIDMSDVAWGYIPDSKALDPEEFAIARDVCQHAFELLSSQMNPLDALSFISLNVLGWKPSTLASRIKEDGLLPVINEIVYSAAQEYQVSKDVFASLINAVHVCTFDKASEKDLSANISRANYRAKAFLKRELRRAA